jgi:hypothetical protein
MKDFFTKSRHFLYRLKTRIFEQSLPAIWIKDKIWNVPSPGVVTVLFKEEQDILHHFPWTDLEDGISKTKLREFTVRYAKEPNIIYHIKGDLVIEPDFGLVINKGRQFVKESGTLSHLFLKPSLFKYIKHSYFRRNYTEYETLIHCDGFVGINLCHFVYDTINPILFMYERKMITKDSPILISEKVFQTSFFQFFLKNTSLGELRWIVQKNNEWISVKEVKKAFVSMEIFKATYGLLSIEKNPRRKIFLNRKTSFQRNITNIDRLMPILHHYGFEEVYAEDLSYAEQVKLFSEVKFFVGIHGAGLTNLLHADISSLHVLEIFSESYVHASFYRFLRILDVKYYDAISGTSLDLNWNYKVHPHEFELKLKKMMEYES